MMAPGRLACLGVESPQMSAYAFRKVLLFRMGLPIPADDGGPGDRVCRCGSFGSDQLFWIRRFSDSQQREACASIGRLYEIHLLMSMPHTLLI